MTFQLREVVASEIFDDQFKFPINVETADRYVESFLF